MDLKLDQEMLSAVVSGAIVNAIDENKRDSLIQGAIKALLTPPESRGYYGTRETPIEQAFNEAVRSIARQVAEQMLSKDESVLTRLRELLSQAVEKVMNDNREATIAKIADALAAGMAYRGRD